MSRSAETKSGLRCRLVGAELAALTRTVVWLTEMPGWAAPWPRDRDVNARLSCACEPPRTLTAPPDRTARAELGAPGAQWEADEARGEGVGGGCEVRMMQLCYRKEGLVATKGVV